VPPNAYAVVRPNENPLVKPGAKVPTPTIVWERLTVRPDHPRLLFNKESRGPLRRRFQESPLMEIVKERAEEKQEPLANAFMYQMTDREAYGRAAIKALLDGTERRFEALIFDWTYDAMTEEERPKAVERLWAEVTIDRASGWPRCSPYTAFPDDPRPSETPPAEWLPFYNWTFHDQDWARKYSRSFVALLALAGHHPRAAEGVRNYWEYSMKDAQLFYDHLRDGSYWQGYYWSITDRIRAIVELFAMVKTATGVDYVDPQKHPYLANVGRWLLYCSDAPRKRIIINYGDSEMVDTGHRVSTAVIASNGLARDPHVEWLLQEACWRSRSDWLAEVIWHDYTIPPKTPVTLPMARAFPGTGLVVMRSKWAGDAVWASVRWADWFDIHCHADVASFILYCKSPLAPDTGYYTRGILHDNYVMRSVAHNTLTIRDPAAVVELNDGSQRLLEKRTWSFAVGQEAWLYNQEYHDRGDLLAFETHKLYDYCAGEGAMAYPPGLVKEFVRQIVFLRDGFFVVFDRVETTRPELEKRWIVHAVGEPEMDGKVVRTEVKGHIEDFEAARFASKGKLGAVMHCHMLLPERRRIRRVGGRLLQIPVSAFVRVPRTTQRIGTGSRWLWTDPVVLYYNDRLTGKKLPAVVLERDRPSVAEYEVNDEELILKFTALERGRVDELRLRFEDYNTLFDVTRAIGHRNLWHTRIHYMPGYEYYNLGTNYAPSYYIHQWDDPPRFAPELVGLPNNQGSWRVEVYPARPATRDYFLNVFRCMPEPDPDTSTVGPAKETPDRVETLITLGERAYLISFAKTGKVAGHIRITENGKVLADGDFVDSIVQKPWPGQE
jgi:hypothetical protein